MPFEPETVVSSTAVAPDLAVAFDMIARVLLVQALEAFLELDFLVPALAQSARRNTFNRNQNLHIIFIVTYNFRNFGRFLFYDC
jgi:hypothetical protein